VNIGQTIVSNQAATSLFLLAKDLGELEVWTSVNEADMANVRVGQNATFTVDAYPGQTFTGNVAQCRPNATMQQNVVTYNIVVSVKNPTDKDHPNGLLLPYMTANVKFIMQKKENVLLVPNSALRYKPSPELIVPDARAKFANKKVGPKGPNDQSAGSGSKDKEELPILWVKDGKYVRPVTIHIGMSDGVSTEVTGKDVEEGTVIVTGESRGGDAGDAKSPFTPQLFKR
jgi:HlyD family secretion protein